MNVTGHPVNRNKAKSTNLGLKCTIQGDKESPDDWLDSSYDYRTIMQTFPLP